MSAGSDIKAGGAYVEISADVGPLESALAGMSGRLQSFSDRMGSVGRDLFAVGLAIKGAFAGAYYEALQAEEIDTRLVMVLKNTGRAAGDNVDVFRQRAIAMTQSTTFSEEAVKQAQTSLAVFKDIDNTKFDRVLQASADLAATLGMDIPEAARMMGRAMEYPSMSLRLLRNAGFDLTDQEKKMLQQFEKTGDSAAAQELILSKLEGTIKGAAKAMSETTGGQWKQLWNEFGEAGEDIGNIFLPMFKQMAQALKEYMAPLRTFIADHQEAIITLAKMAAGATVFGAALIGLSKVLGIVAAVTTPLGMIVVGLLAIAEATGIVNFGLGSMVGGFEIAGRSITEWMLLAYKGIYQGWVWLKLSLYEGIMSVYNYFQDLASFIVSVFDSAINQVAKGMLSLQELLGVNLFGNNRKNLDDGFNQREGDRDREKQDRWKQYEAEKKAIANQTNDDINKIDDALKAKSQQKELSEYEKKNRKTMEELRAKLSMSGLSAGASKSGAGPSMGGFGGGEVVGQYGAAGWETNAWQTGVKSDKTDQLLDQSSQQTDYQKQMVDLLSKGGVAGFGE